MKPPKKVSWSGNRGIQDNYRLNMELLHVATTRDTDKIVSLLAAGADPNVQDQDGNTPLHHVLTLSCNCPTCAESAGSSSAVLLQATGIDVNILNNRGETPLQIAASYELEQCIQSLVSAGAYSYTSNEVETLKTGGENLGFDILPEKDYQTNEDFIEVLNEPSELLDAAAARDPDRILALLKEYSHPNIQDNDGSTALHLAVNLDCSCNSCISNVESCCAVLLNHSGIQVNLQNKNGQTPLHIAALNQLQRCAEDLIFKGADCYIMSNDGTAAMTLIATEIPDLMCKILDQSIVTTGNHHKKQNCVMEIDFRPIILLKKPFPRKAGSTKTQQEVFSNELKLLKSVLSTDLETQKKIFLHPVVGIFLDQKWTQGRIYLITNVIIRLIWLLCFTNYIVLVYLVKCPLTSKSNNGSTGEANIGQNVGTTYIAESKFYRNQLLTDEQKKCVEASECNMEFILICVVTIWRVGFNMLELYFSKKVHLRDFYHIIVMFMVVGTFYPTITHQKEIPAIQYQYAAFTVFVAWSMNIGLFGKFKKIGGYFEMFGHVLWRFLTILPTFIFLFVAFAFAFCILFPSKLYFNPFPFAVVRVLLMTVEMDYQSMFYGTDSMGSHGPIVGHLLFVIFVVVVPIVLLNLIIGLTVSDIQSLQKEAELKRITIQIREMYNMECILYSWKLPDFLRTFLRKSLSVASKLKKGDSNQLYFSFKINDPKDTSVPPELKLAIKPLVERIHNERAICKTQNHYELDRSRGVSNKRENVFTGKGNSSMSKVDAENPV